MSIYPSTNKRINRARRSTGLINRMHYIRRQVLAYVITTVACFWSHQRGIKDTHFNGIMWNANLMQQGNFIDVFLALHVSGTYAHLQEHQMLSCSIWFCPPSFWMGGGLESRCVGRVYGADGARHHDVGRVYPKHVKLRIHQ